MKSLGLHMLNASEFSLTIALVVFVMITILLIAILVLLCVSKNFRVFFFRENRDRPTTDESKKTEAETERSIVSDSKPDKTETSEKPAPTAARRPRKKAAETFGVPTVPLTLIAPAPAAKSRTKKSADSSWEDEAFAAQSEKTTFIPRTAPKKKNGKNK